jgi:glycosyltransferase involved in cell wall biosynthesis
MKLAWFTPFNPRSAIGHFSNVLVDELARQHDVTVFVPEDEGGQAPRPTRLPVVRVPAQPTEAWLRGVDAFDLAVYNLGDYFPYHQAIYEVSIQRPGLIILHDLVMRDFFMGYFLLHQKRPFNFAAHAGFSDGPEAEQHARDVIAGRRVELSDDPIRLRYPMFRSAVQRGLGVVVHSEYARRRVGEAVACPVHRLDFPRPSAIGTAAATGERVRGDKVRLLTFGVLNPNKLVHATLEAIGQSDVLRRAVRFTVIGEGTKAYMDKLRGLIARYGLGEAVVLAGWCPDDRLGEELARADVVVNLRNPHQGESSWSLLDALFAGVATVVWDHGFYGEFGDDVVCKVRAESHLRPALERLVTDADHRRRLGATARAHALERFRTDRYCQGLVEFGELVRSQRPLWALTDHVSERLVELGSNRTDGLAGRIAAELGVLARPLLSA